MASISSMFHALEPTTETVCQHEDIKLQDSEVNAWNGPYNPNGVYAVIINFLPCVDW